MVFNLSLICVELLYHFYFFLPSSTLDNRDFGCPTGGFSRVEMILPEYYLAGSVWFMKTSCTYTAAKIKPHIFPPYLSLDKKKNPQCISHIIMLASTSKILTGLCSGQPVYLGSTRKRESQS